MPKQTKTCRVCGAKYEACNSVRTGGKTFNWREVACSPECGMVYLDKITASRSIVEPQEESFIITFPLAEMVEKHEPEEPKEETEMISEDFEESLEEDI